jgi:hypothetical protein
MRIAQGNAIYQRVIASLLRSPFSKQGIEIAPPRRA